MKMKTVVLFSLFAGLAFVACQNDSGTAPATNNDLLSGEFAIIDIDDAVAVLSDATLDDPITMDPQQLGGFFGPNHRGRFGQGPRFGHDGRFGPGGRGPGRHLGPILQELDLSDEQIEQIRQLMEDFRTCAGEAFADLHEIIQPIIDEANAQREAIIEALRNGEITREEAGEQLRALSESVRDAIQNSPETEAAREALCVCKLEHFQNIRAVLTEAQQAIWDNWIAEHGARGCGE